VVNGNAWSQRAPVIASLIRFHKFDVLGVQEAYRSQLNDLQALMPAYAFSGRGRDDGREAGEHAAIFYRKDAFTLQAEGMFWLSETPEKPSIGWDAKFNRVCTWVKLEDHKTRKAFFVFNTHFDHQGSIARAESARLILKAVTKISGGQPAILTGDFNVNQTSESYKLIHDSGLLDDSYETTTERYALNGTPNGFNINSYSESRIDHIFHSHGFKPVRYGVLTDSYRTPPLPADTTETGSVAFPSEVKFKNYEARTPSDHFPVLVEFE
jgi:endonuclease/exonuclease/phosphatase family metal-dependent hydrolase